MSSESPRVILGYLLGYLSVRLLCLAHQKIPVSRQVAFPFPSLRFYTA